MYLVSLLSDWVKVVELNLGFSCYCWVPVCIIQWYKKKPFKVSVWSFMTSRMESGEGGSETSKRGALWWTMKPDLRWATNLWPFTLRVAACHPQTNKKKKTLKPLVLAAQQSKNRRLQSREADVEESFCYSSPSSPSGSRKSAGFQLPILPYKRQQTSW